jgi:hypothetical protein
MSEIIRDQSLDKQPELRSTIRLKVFLPKIEQAKLNFNDIDNFNKNTFIDKTFLKSE